MNQGLPVSLAGFTLLEKVLHLWRAQGTGLNLGASDVELARLESFLRVALPADVRDYFAAANGMLEGESTGYITCFWPIERIVTDSHVQQGIDAHGEFRDIAFVDVMIDAWFVWLRVRADRVSIFVEAMDLELPSLTEFFTRYLESSGALAM